MASLSQSPWISPLQTTIPTHSIKPTFSLSSNTRPSTFRTLQISASAVSRPNDDETQLPNSTDTAETLEEPKLDRVKLALERAREYKKSLKVEEIQQNGEYPDSKLDEIVGGNDGFVSGYQDEGSKEVLEDVRVAVEREGERKQTKGMVGNGRSSVDGANFPAETLVCVSEGEGGGKEEVPEALRIAMEKGKEYNNNKGKVDDNETNEKREQLTGGGEEEVPEDVRIAMEKAIEYRKNGTIADSITPSKSSKLTGSEGGRSNRLEDEGTESKIGKKEELKVSSIDFVGLGFADKKKSRGLPAGLVPISDPFPEGDLPEVEVIVGDASNFGQKTSSETKTSAEEESSDLYKPKVSTWGVFPRPSDISKTFGGGKTIRPGQVLESPEDRAAKEARTKQLVAAYKKKIGLNMDPKLRAECEEALKDGDSLMDVGRLKEALPYYQQVMDKLPFQTELHGLAALQWSICQDSLSRSEEARVMYEKLQSHPTARVSKRAREFVFSFQAMEMLRVKRPTVSPRSTGYQNYFEAFVKDKENYTSGRSELEEGAPNQALPYILFLAAPILLVLLIGASK